MFERYTERARRVLFFARYEASQLGSISIETEHLLLGLIREGKGLTARIFARAHLSYDEVCQQIESRSKVHQKLSVSVEIPFSAETKRVLGCAAEEADRLLHNYIGTEHLLLGLLREERSVAASILMKRGMRLHTVRDDIVRLLNESTSTEADEEITDAPPRAATAQDSRHGFNPGSIRAMRMLMLPAYVPSHVVHISYSDLPPGQEPWIFHAGNVWRALGYTLTQIVAHAWGADESRVRLAAPGVDDAHVRYDFTMMLPNADGPEVIPRLLRQSIERDLQVDVTREDGDGPTLVVRPR